MEILKSQLEGLLATLPDAEAVQSRLSEIYSCYPFNEFEYTISTLLGRGVLSLDEYYELRDNYLDRNAFLYIFEISAPRVFGEGWAQGQLRALVPDLSKPSKKLDANYSGQYDFYLDSEIRIEVKASRAVDKESDEPLYVKALPSDSSKLFWMNFQQVKPGCCDVFVWVAVWRDKIRYWVSSSYEIENHSNYSKGQHRGNEGEGQIHLRNDNINDYAQYEVLPHQLAEKIREAYQREIVARR